MGGGLGEDAGGGANYEKPPPNFVHPVFCPGKDSPTQATVATLAADAKALAVAPPDQRLSVIYYQIAALEQQRWTREMCGVAWDGDEGAGGLKHAPGDMAQVTKPSKSSGGGGGDAEESIGGNSPGTVLWEALFQMRMRSMALVRLHHGSNR